MITDTGLPLWCATRSASVTDERYSCIFSFSVAHRSWVLLNEKMQEYLSSVSLADLVAHQSGKPVSVIKDFRPAPEKVAA